ncbi:hypothetical protein FA95DRAFT_1562344 [Auriscalpium vulgare]|uniref:Uncharacterized protein n=1 Tax=Auriscalpium vulgare TaxID=40419 RepID=A0ACB8RJJ4_9AGAM|nr:hypothetical protein FA95DRAFT_1562344 [Auriscalpium vulgare]
MPSSQPLSDSPSRPETRGQPRTGQPITQADISTVFLQRVRIPLRWCYPVTASPLAALDDIRLLPETAQLRR